MGDKATNGGASDKDCQSMTGATDKETSAAHHDARDAFVKDYGDGSRTSLDPATNGKGYERAFPK